MCHRHRWMCLVGSGWLALAPMTVWGDVDAMLDDAIAVYGEAMETAEGDQRIDRFRHAARLFAQVDRDRGVPNAALQVNLGNAALLGHDMGTAVLAYRRALALRPGHEQARNNLEHARAMLPDWVPRPAATGLFDTFFFWVQELSPTDRSLLAAIVGFGAAALGAAGWRYRRRWARNLALLVGLAWVGLVTTTVWDARGRGATDVVVTVPHTVARTADSAGAPPRFQEPLPAGTEAALIEQRDDWAHLRLANGRDAWVRAHAVTPVAAE